MQLNQLRLDVASAFSAYPAGRDDRDGEFNGERFREQFLKPKLEEAFSSGQTLTVSFEGVRSFGSSFLEEAFGGLVRNGIPAKKVLDTIEFVFGSRGRTRYQDALRRYIVDAGKLSR